MYHFVYETTNLVNNKKYIGKHSSKTLDDDYIGSGVALGRAIEKYGVKSFKREILCMLSSAEEALQYEAKLVTESIVNSPNYYNMRKGGNGGQYHYTSKDKDKMSKSAKERIARDGHPLKGKERTPNSKLKLSITNKTRYKEDPTCHGMYSHSHSAETKSIMSKSAKERVRTEDELNRIGKLTKGSSWWNNGIINKRIRAGEEPPENFVKGRLICRL